MSFRMQLRMRIRVGISSVLAVLALFAPQARADRRTLIRAYEYMTQPQGNLEFEVWNDINAPKAGFAAADTIHRFELEYGVTDHFDLSLYHVLAQGPGEPLHFDSWRLETRYRLLEKGEWPVDVLLYFEVERPAAFAEPWETEQKLILERSFGPFALVANLVGEQKLLHAREGRRYEIDLGARYEVSPVLRLGVEGWTIQETVHGVTSGAWFAGPSLSVATPKLWIQLGAGFGLGIGDGDATAQVRSVLGFNL